MSDAWKVSLPPSAKAVFMALIWRANGKRTCWPSIAELTEMTGLSDRAIRYALSYLADEKLIAIESGRGRSSATYHINSNPAVELIEDEPNRQMLPSKAATRAESKERKEIREDVDRLSPTAKRDLDRAKMIRRRSEVKATFEALCHLYADDISITAPMVAREMGIPVTKARADLSSLLRNQDLPDIYAMRFGKTKFNPRHARKLQNVIPFQRAGR